MSCEPILPQQHSLHLVRCKDKPTGPHSRDGRLPAGYARLIGGLAAAGGVQVDCAGDTLELDLAKIREGELSPFG